MKTPERYPDEVMNLLDRALREDIGSGDITTESVFAEGSVSTGTLCVKEAGIISGIGIAGEVFRKLDPECEWKEMIRDGELVKSGDTIACVTGASRAIICAERTALNILQKMSGVSTLTDLFVSAVSEFEVKIMDTRKTPPGLRWICKYAVAAGGGLNHRRGLYDGVLIKDNHIKAGGGVAAAVEKVRRKVGGEFAIEVETKTTSQVKEALACGADVIMLDNMDVRKMKEIVQFVNGRALIEASGGITLDKVRDVAATGVDLISVGALTHSAPSLDISFDVLE